MSKPTASAHDDGAVSSSSDDGHGGPRSGRRRRGEIGSRPPAAGATHTVREQNLSELLTRALKAIKEERAKVAQLEHENQQLRKSCGSAQPPMAPASSGPQGLLRSKLQELSLDYFIAVEEIARLRRRVDQLEQQLAVHVVLSPMKDSPARKASPQKQRSHSAQPMGRHSRRTAAPATASSASPQKSARGVTPSPQRVPPQNHHFDPMRSVQHVQQTAVDAAGISSQRTPSAHSRGAATAAAVGGGSGGLTQGAYNEVMIHRLKRALAPPPTKEQLGEVVHAMVTEMSRQLKQQGTHLGLTKVDHCVYRLNAKRLNLTVDSGRLVVKCGGGHVDLLEYLERNKVCTPLPASSAPNGAHGSAR